MIASGRRVSSYVIPIAKPKKTAKGKDKQRVLDEDWVADRVEENIFINQVRNRVKLWREGRYKHVTKTTARSRNHPGISSLAITGSPMKSSALGV